MGSAWQAAAGSAGEERSLVILEFRFRCPVCSGHGVVPTSVICVPCRGFGKLRVIWIDAAVPAKITCVMSVYGLSLER